MGPILRSGEFLLVAGVALACLGSPSSLWAAPRDERSPSPAPTADATEVHAPPSAAPGQGAKGRTWQKVRRVLSRVELGTLWYLQYRYGRGTSADGRTDVEYNQFQVSRGYLDVRFRPTPWFEGRITPDLHQDAEGDFKLRLKYLYAKFKLPRETVVVSEPSLEVGIVHMPFLGFEESIAQYRMQGTMFAERQGLFNSADLGLTASVLLGRKLPKAVSDSMYDRYPGTWGSLVLGLYNGTGYHGIEKNMGKVLEGRVTLRPLGQIHPNLQLSYFFIWGKGNATAEDSQPYPLPDWQHHHVMLSWSHPYLAATAQYISGRGRQRGEGSAWVSPDDGTATPYQGASGFLEVRLPWIWSSVLCRYDWFEGPNPSPADSYHRLIAGYAFHFWGRNKNVLLLDFDWAILEETWDIWAVTLTLQVKL